MKLLENTENNLNKDKYAEKVSNIEISGIGLVDCDTFNGGYGQFSTINLYFFTKSNPFKNVQYRVFFNFFNF